MGSNVFARFYMDVSRLELVSLLVRHNFRDSFLLVLHGSLSIRITGWYTEMVLMTSPETVEKMMSGIHRPLQKL
jgi:hypothetical protein